MNRCPRWRLLAAAACVPLALTALHADDTERKQLAYTREHYTKFEYRIPMRDGVRLFAVRAQGPHAPVPHPDAAHALLGPAVRRG